MTFFALCMVVGGLLLLLFGGEVLLRGAVSLAGRLGLSPLLIGMTVVAAATSMPEMVVAIAAGLKNAPDIGVGNVVGSNIANILLILGAAALVSPIRTRPEHIKRDGMAMLGATLLFIVLAHIGTIGRVEGGLMLVLLIVYMVHCYRQDRKPDRAATAQNDLPDVENCLTIPVSLLLVGGGVGLLVVGSKLLVEGSVDLARVAGVSEAVIGLSLVAIGTSLPELATGIVASFRRHPEVALGNVLGSNIFNIMAIIPALAITSPFQVTGQILAFDNWVMAGVTVLALVVMLTGWTLSRREAIGFLVIYAAYLGFLFSNGMMPLPA